MPPIRIRTSAWADRRALACVAVLLAAGPVAAAAQASAPAPAGLTIVVTVPAGTPADTGVYVAGTFNDWNPAAPGYRMASAGPGRYSLALPDSVRGGVEFKFTLGSWDAVEVSASGGDVPNRAFDVPATGAATYTGAVAGWRDARAVKPRAHTARPTVSVMDTAFAVPQLGLTRRVWLYLPPGYATTTRRYPVLYLQDGQNVFDAATSYAGEWGVDETLDSLRALGDPGIIVVAVDNGPKRMDEYQPWPATMKGMGGGEGMAYAEFLVHTLKPYVDAHYRTRPGRLDTGVGGSSLGGLISFYAAVRYPEVFGRALVFSPSFFIDPQVYALARAARPRRPPARFYFVSGATEGGQGELKEAIPRGQIAMVDTLAAAGFDTARDVRSLLPADGAHAEWFWRREFPAAYLWLFRSGRAGTPGQARGGRRAP